jgi:signal transduction histidine kinase
MKDAIPSNRTLFRRLAAINRTITASLGFEEALGLIAGSGVELVGAASCLVLLQEGEEALRICAAQGVDPAVAARFVGPMEESVLGRLQEYLGLARSQNIAAFPIMSDLRVQGILVVISDAPLTEEETWLLSALAEQAAITLGNAHLYETLISRETKLQDEVARSRKHAGELEELIHSVAQDLQARLQTMTGSGKLLLDEYGEQFLSGRGREYLVRIASGARKMESLIQDLVAYSHLARAELNLEYVDLEGAVLEALAGLETEIKSRGGLLRVESPPFKVLAHRGTLVRILGNLLSNAVKFVSPGEQPRVGVKAELLGEVVRVSVLDDGIGISEADLGRIFGVFERLNQAEEYRGVGIGLAIVQRGIERMGGRCGVESKLGKGSRFWIELRGA